MLRKLESEDARPSTEGGREIRGDGKSACVAKQFADMVRRTACDRQAGEGPGQLKLETDAAALRKQGVSAAVVSRIERTAWRGFLRLVGSVAGTGR